MKSLLPLLLLVLGASAPATAQESRDDLTPLELAYATALTGDRQSFQVELTIGNVSRPALHLAMPAWTPGAYGIRDYGKNVRELSASGGEGRELEVTKMSSGTWSVATAGESRVRVTYEVPVSTRRRFGRGEEDAPITGVRLSGPGTYLYVRGAKETPVICRFSLPEGWRVATGLLPTDDPFLWRAKDYDTFIDAPATLGIFEERHFEVNGTGFSCVFFENAQEYDFDLDAFVDIVRRIAVNQGELFGSYPFPNYVFLFSLPGGGGLEHLNSTTIGLNARSQKEDPEAGASVTSHEFFHAWNVKRIRPLPLGPFDYQRENYTGNLWVSEGWTSYFGDLTLVRTGILDQREFLDLLERIISREGNKERRKEHSVYWASRNSWHRFPDEEGSRVDYYGKGELLGAMIDLKMRHETGNRKSLNDVMRFLNRWFAERNVGFEEGDIERACTAISNHDFHEFFARHVYGTIDPPLAEYLAYAGIDYAEDVISCAFPFALRGTRIAGRRRAPDAEEQPGPRPGETIAAIDGAPFLDENEFLRRHAPGDVVTLTLERRGEEREVEVTLGDQGRVIPVLTLREDATELQLAIREAWLSSVE